MAQKRKVEDTGVAVSSKQRRTGTPIEGAGSNDSLSIDHVVEFTDNGTRRAESEARRAWNYICEYAGCGQRFNRPCRLENHLRSHNNERPFCCAFAGCGKTFPRKDHLQRHVKSVHEELQRQFTCEWKDCDKSFSSQGRLQRHRDVHNSKFYCTDYPPCNEVFRKSRTLESHIKTTHLAVKAFPCDHKDPDTGEQCMNGYQTELGLRRHVQKAHSSAEEAKHYCMACMNLAIEYDSLATEIGEDAMLPYSYLSFASLKQLQLHQREVHPPTCIECGSTFRDQAGLKSHMQTVHGDPESQPRFACNRSDCNAVFNRKHNLAVHIQSVHDHHIKFICSREAAAQSKRAEVHGWDGQHACGAGFKAKSSLEQHIRTRHLGLQNRKVMRRMAKPKKPEETVLSMLTGIGYEKGRDVPCVLEGCEFRFFMDRDLRRHLQAEHDFSAEEVETMLFDRDASNGGQFWLGGLDEKKPASAFDSVEPSMPQTPLHVGGDPGFLPVACDPTAASTTGGILTSSFKDLAMFDPSDADLDAAMGLDDLAPAVDAQAGLQWQMLDPL